MYLSKVTGLFWCFTFGRFGPCSDAVLVTVDLLSLHHDVLETFVVSVEAVLQQFAQRHRAARKKYNMTLTAGV